MYLTIELNSGNVYPTPIMISSNYQDLLLEAYTNLREGCGRIAIKRDVVSVTGPDSAKFLQGQMTQDISSLPEGRSTYSFLLRPDSRVVALVRVSKLSDDYLLVDTDYGWGNVVAERLNKFKIRTKVTIELLDYVCVAVRGALSGVALGMGGTDQSSADPGKLQVDALPTGDAATDPGELQVMDHGVVALPVLWPGLAGYDLLGNDLSAMDPLVGDIPEYPPDTSEVLTEVLRIESGIPAMGREIDSNTIPAYTSILDRAVSFGKGCYVGQELVERIDSRGSNVPKRLCRLVERDSVAPIDILDLSAITSAVRSPGSRAYVCMGYVPRKINTGDIVELLDASGDRDTSKNTAGDDDVSTSTVGFTGLGRNTSELLGKVFEVAQ